jgi:hypothetical protein
LLETEQKMAKSPHKVFYLSTEYDTTLDPSFKYKRGFQTKIKDKNPIIKGFKTGIKNTVAAATPIFDVGMVPFNQSMRFSRIIAYNIYEEIGKQQGLNGARLDDFIFGEMSKSGQIADLNTIPLIQRDTVLKSLFFLKNFMIKTAELEADNQRRFIGSVLKRKVDPKAAKAVLAYSVIPSLLFGVGTSPLFYILNGAITGLGYVANSSMTAVSGGQAPTFDPDIIKQLQSADKWSWQGILGRGVAGEATGISTKQFRIDPISGLGQKPIPIQTAEDIASAAHSIAFAATSSKDKRSAYATILTEGDKFLRKQSVVYGRVSKAAGVLKDGQLKSASGIPLLDEPVDKKDRPITALLTSSGFSTQSEEIQTTRTDRLVKTVDQYNQQREFYADKAAEALYNKNETRMAEILTTAAQKGFPVTKDMLENRLTSKAISFRAKKIKNLSKQQRYYIYNKYPELLK